MGSKRNKRWRKFEVCSDHGQQDDYYAQNVFDEVDKGCRQYQRKRPGRLRKLLIDLSEYMEFCLDPACTGARYPLPCGDLDARRNGAVAAGDSLHFSSADRSKPAAAAEALNSKAFRRWHAEKQAQVQDCGRWICEDHTGSSHEQELMECKLKIMATRLAYGGEVWSLAAQLVNPYEALPSVAVRVLNRAFFKMWELMHMFPGLVPSAAAQPKFLSGHICEGPGGFIQAIRMLRLRDAESGKWTKTRGSLPAVDSTFATRATQDSWFAISLFSPGGNNDAMKMQAKKIEDFMSTSDEGYIHYGVDESGNVLNPDNIASFVQFVLRKTNGEKLHLITGDGAFDVSDDFGLQEQSHVHLFFCEILTAARLLCHGGAFILKVFDCFTEMMATVLYILTLLYRRVEIVRLRTSRVCNSERFVVAQGFEALPKSLEDKLMSICKAWYDAARDGFVSSLKTSIPYPRSFLEALDYGNAAVANIQSTAILKAVAVAEDLGERLSYADTSSQKGILGVLKRKIKTLDVHRANALALCENLDIPFANT